VTRRKRQPSAAVRRAVAVERRAAELAQSRSLESIRLRMNGAEDDGWAAHRLYNTPRGPAELAGWLAREIWSES
jgi:hypothetical protein